jgi:hypothetical protein
MRHKNSNKEYNTNLIRHNREYHEKCNDTILSHNKEYNNNLIRDNNKRHNKRYSKASLRHRKMHDMWKP